MVVSSLSEVFWAGFFSNRERVRKNIFAFAGRPSQNRDHLPACLSYTDSGPGNDISGDLIRDETSVTAIPRSPICEQIEPEIYFTLLEDQMNLFLIRSRDVTGLNSSRRRVSALNSGGDPESFIRLGEHCFGKFNSEYPEIRFLKCTLFTFYIDFVLITAKQRPPVRVVLLKNCAAQIRCRSNEKAA